MNNSYKLIYLKNNQEFVLDDLSTLVGRSDSCPIRVDVSNMSREHARILIRDEGVFVQDLHSTNGTFVEGKRISEATLLTPGSTVQFGEEVFSLQEIDDEVTIVAIPHKNKSKRAESSVVEDEDEEDSTVLFQAYQLPPGWSNLDNDATDFDSADTELKKRAINAYVKKTSLAFKGAKGIVMFFFVEDEPPSIRSLSLQDESDKEWTIGRTEASDIFFKHQGISEKHAILKYQNKNWTVVDTQSKNGIWHNKNRLEQVALEDEMHLYFGTVEVLFRFVNY